MNRWNRERIEYRVLNARGKENYNAAKLGAVLADFGYHCMRLTDDYGGADVLAIHADGEVLKIQLKARLTLNPKYMGKSLLIAFPDGADWYMFPHDEVAELIESERPFMHHDSWTRDRNPHWSWPTLPAWIRQLLEPWRVR